MSTNKTFNENNKTGKIGERLFQDWIEGKGNVCFNVSDHSTYQQLDIDFIVLNSRSKKVTNVEVKTDSLLWKTGNFAVEKWEDLNQSKGWFYKTLADIIVVCDKENEILYMFHLKTLKEYIAIYEDTIRLNTCKEPASDYTNGIRTRQYWLVNLDKFIKYCTDNKYYFLKVDTNEEDILL